MFRNFFSNQEIHGEECCGSREDVGRMRTKLFLTEAQPCSRAFRFAIWSAARTGHRKCLRFLLKECNLQVGDPEFMKTIIFLTTHSDSCRTLDLGLRLMELLSATARHRILIELLDSMVIKDNRRNLLHLLQRLGASCPTQSRFRSTMPQMIFRHNTPLTAVWWKRPECLRLLLRQGAVVDHTQLPPMELSDEQKEEVSLILSWTTSLRYIRDNATIEASILRLLYEFGANPWETNRDGLTPLNLITTYPLDDLEAKHSPAKKRDVVATKLQTMMQTPRSLMSACRVSIIRTLGPAPLKKLDALKGKLPLSLVEYLKFEDLQTESGGSLEEESDSSGEEEFSSFLESHRDNERNRKKPTKRRRSSEF